MAYRNIGIYRGSDTIRYHLGLFKTHTPNEWCVYDDLGHFLNSEHPANIGFVHFPYPFDSTVKQLLDCLRNRCDHVFVIVSELHNVTCEFIQQNDHANVSYYICGQLNFSLEHAEVHEFYDWFETSSHFYKNYLPEILGRIRHTEVKLESFDILLGRKKLHRDTVYNFVKENLRPEQYLMTYFNRHDTDFDSGTNMWSWEQPGLKFVDTPKWTVDRIEYFGHRMSLSQVIPIDIYNRSNYSVIAETNYDNSYSFFTEKTAKPIIARRLFIMFAGQYYLRNLRNLGFQTFDGIIDESYDKEPDNNFRWQAACEQLRLLSKQDPEKILKKIQPVVDHNFNIMMTTDWMHSYITQLEADVDKILQRT